MPGVTALKACVAVKYRHGVRNTLEREVPSVADEVAWKFARVWEAIAVDNGKINVHEFEEAVCPTVKALGAVSVADDLCASTMVARAALVQALGNVKLDGQADLVPLVMSRSNAWLRTDRDFGVEIATMWCLGGNVCKAISKATMRVRVVGAAPFGQPRGLPAPDEQA